MNKTIYTTYHSRLPPIVLKRWKDLNPEYTIDFSMDVDCVRFLESAFSRNVAELFIYIPRGMYKADLWRLCKLYIHGGVYADIDLVPYIPISTSIIENTTSGNDTVAGPGPGPRPGYFYSCLSLSSPSIFQAFMYQSRAKSPLILGFLVSFLVNKPYTNIDNGPTSDMYHFLLYNIRAEAVETKSTVVPPSLQPYTHYTLRKIRIPIYVSSLDEDIVHIHYFPQDVAYTLTISPNTRNRWVLANQDKLQMKIENHFLIVKIINDTETATDYDDESFIVNICIDLPEGEPEDVYLFQECIRDPSRISTCYIADCNGMNIMDCRDPNYMRDHGWINN